MKIKIADPAGFCFGVNRAIRLAEESVKNHKKVNSLGPLIHNSDEVNRLNTLGINTINSLSDLKNDPVIIRSHGETKAIYQEIREKGNLIIDATCPFVSKLQRLIQDYSEQKYIIYLLGNKNHPEVKGAVGWGSGEIYVVNSTKDLPKVIKNQKSLLVSQTTMREDDFITLESFLNENITDLVSINTICSATRDRQQAAMNLSKEVDAMIIIGGKHSSNTKKLVELCKVFNNNTFLFENNLDMDVSTMKKYDMIGISAGASTPQWVIDAVIDELQMER